LAAQYPRIDADLFEGFNCNIRLSCESTDDTFACSYDTQYIFQLDAYPLGAYQQELRIYDSGGSLLETLNCTTTGAQAAFKGLNLGYRPTSGVNRTLYDNLKISFSDLPAP
jgi:hypothetical protein